MKKIFFLAAVVLFVACNNSKSSEPKTAMDVGRSFIRASLDGDFKHAEPLLLKDEENAALFESYKRSYQKLSENKREAYKAASYNINKMEEPNDSTSIINYSNSFMNKPMEIKLVYQNGQWLVDFKYTFSGNLPIE